MSLAIRENADEKNRQNQNVWKVTKINNPSWFQSCPFRRTLKGSPRNKKVPKMWYRTNFGSITNFCDFSVFKPFLWFKKRSFIAPSKMIRGNLKKQNGWTYWTQNGTLSHFGKLCWLCISFGWLGNLFGSLTLVLRRGVATTPNSFRPGAQNRTTKW